ncbi:MAG: hypothetical protein K2I10_11320 [Lachnospiraceae bacterium]|nr:hypothetical protein [Lachnospiraceae bacterium]
MKNQRSAFFLPLTQKTFKKTKNSDAPSKKYEYIVQEIWARAILHNLSSTIISEVDISNRKIKYEYQVNFAEAQKKFCVESD